MLFGISMLLVVRAVVMGRWLPKSTHELITAELRRRAEAAEKARDVADGQVGKLLVYAEAADRILKSLPRAGGGDDVRSP